MTLEAFEFRFFLRPVAGGPTALGEKSLGVTACMILLATGVMCLGAAPEEVHGRGALPAKVERVLFLGDSITYAGKYVELVEAYFITRYPGRKLEFINAGLPSETVSGLSEEGHANGKFPRPVLRERLGRVLDQTKPDMVFACYGMNDGIYLPLSDERFAKFKQGMEWLHEQVARSRAGIVHVTPPTFDEVKGGHPGYSAVLGKYSAWLLAQRKAAGWDVVDLHGPMDKYLAERRKTDPNFAYAADGVHANEVGHRIIARQILLHLGAADIGEAMDGSGMLAAWSEGDQVLKLVHERQDMMKDAWLTATGHQRPGMKKGLPLVEAQSRAAEMEERIQGLVKRSI